jgi:predicted permease
MENWLRLQPRFRPLIEQRSNREGQVWARRRAGVGIAQAQAEVEAVARALSVRRPETNRYLTGYAWDEIKDRARGGRNLTAIAVLILGILLAVACANAAGLLLARAEERRHETAVRQASGASRARLMREWITESFVLASAGAAISLVAASAIMKLLPGLLPSMPIPLHFEFSFGSRVWTYALFLLLASALSFGIVPAWRGSRPDLLSGLRRDFAFNVFRVRVPVRSLLIIAQVAAAEVLLFGGGLVLSNLSNLRERDTGFDPGRSVVITTVVSGSGAHVDYEALSARLAQVGGVRTVAYGSPATVPVSGMAGPKLEVELPDHTTREILGGSAAPGFLPAFGVRIISGRDLVPSDANGVLVNASLARLIHPDGHAQGRQVRIGGNLVQAVGVFADTAFTSVRENMQPRAIALAHARGGRDTALAIEVAGAAKGYLPALRSEIQSAVPQATLAEITTLPDHYRDALFLERMATQLLYVMGLLALLLTTTGLHGNTAARFARRSREFAIRLALGASPGHVMQLVARNAVTLTACGLVLGLGIALPLAVVLASMQSGFTLWSLPALGLSSAVVLLAGIAAAAKPALRTLGIQPASIIRAE